MGADVTLLDTDLDKLRMSFWRYNNRVHGLASSKLGIEQVMEANLVIGAVLIPGAAAPKLVADDLVSRMKQGSVLVSIAIDQAGASRTATRPRMRTRRTRCTARICCVANMPGAVPNTSTYALTNATMRTPSHWPTRAGSRRAVRTPACAGSRTPASSPSRIADAVGIDAVALDDALA